jgi:hypothetical protein
MSTFDNAESLGRAPITSLEGKGFLPDQPLTIVTFETDLLSIGSTKTLKKYRAVVASSAVDFMGKGYAVELTKVFTSNGYFFIATIVKGPGDPIFPMILITE